MPTMLPAVASVADSDVHSQCRARLDIQGSESMLRPIGSQLALVTARCPGLQHRPQPVGSESARCYDSRAASEEWAMDAPWPLCAAPRCITSGHRRSLFMNQRFLNQRLNRRAVLALVLVVTILGGMAQ